jgi:hypothetical protein
MTTYYSHTQPGYISGGATGAGFLVALSLLLKGAPVLPVGLPVAAILGGAAVAFSSLTIEIEDGVLRSYFGPGLPARTVQIHEIESVQVVQNPWYASWGIRLLPQGWLYNVAGRQAVEVRLKSGKRFRLGTDEPDTLRRAIESAMASRG